MFGHPTPWISARAGLGVAALLVSLQTQALSGSPTESAVTGQGNVPIGVLASELKVGDVVFIRVTARPFMEVSSATQSWTNHVGVVVDTSGTEPLIGESTFPVSRARRSCRVLSRGRNIGVSP